jgi:5-methylthioadenosine/S-adenosylhomocysteine deaminase
VRTAYRNGTFFTIDPDHSIIEDGWLIVEDQTIQYIGSYDARLLPDVDHTVDLQGKWVLPGLVNTHTHILMTMMRGIGDDMLLQPWLETKILPMESRYSTEMAIASAKLGILEMLKSGTTAFSDMFNPNGIDTDAVIHAIADTGITGAFSRALFSFGSEAEQRTNLVETERFAKTYKSFGDGRLTTMLTPHSPYACTPEALEESARIARENRLMVHIHVSETENEVREIQSRYGVRPFEHVRRCGIFDQSAIIAHGVMMNEEERRMLREHGVAVAHNPISNLKLGSGIADISSLLDIGVKVGIGTDGAASNNNLDMFEELRAAALLQKGLHRDASKLPARQVLALATRLGAEAIGMLDIGSLEVGKRANFITISPHDKPHLQPAQEALSHLVYAVSGKDVCDVFIHGRQVVRNSQCLTIDEEKTIYDTNRFLAAFTP